MTSSMQVDLSRGNKLEVPWLSGAVAELAKQSGTAAPLNRAVADIVAPYANGSPRTGSP
jgi:2-dehydropantoate 2-reductase